MAIVVVAIPDAENKVWDISSEKVPHLTLLYIDDVHEDPEVFPLIVQHIEHAASQLSPFGLTVDHRGILGSEDADVLFFEKQYDQLARIEQFRSDLLKFGPIKKAHAAVEQFPEWTPHVTLGYPATPAKKLNENRSEVHYVDFDRIAIWTGDYKGLEFRLRWRDYLSEGPDRVYASHTDIPKEGVMTDRVEAGEQLATDILAHYGVKGMKWGVTTVDKAAKATPKGGRNSKLVRGPKEVTVRQRKAGTYVQTKGGQRQTATPDAIKGAAARQKAKKSTTDSLTTDELRTAIERMNLEQQFTKLSRKTDRQTRGQKIVKSLQDSNLLALTVNALKD